MFCECCGKEHNGDYGSGRFCSRHCYCSRNFSKESRKRISDSNKANAYKRYGYKNVFVDVCLHRLLY